MDDFEIEKHCAQTKNGETSMHPFKMRKNIGGPLSAYRNLQRKNLPGRRALRDAYVDLGFALRYLIDELNADKINHTQVSWLHEALMDALKNVENAQRLMEKK